MFSDSYMWKSHPNKLATVPNTFPLWTLQGHLSVLFLPSEEECTLINVVLVNIVIYYHKKNKNKQKSNSKSSYGIWYYISYLSILSFFSVTPHTLQAGKHENIWPHPSYRQDAEAKSIWPECKKISVPGTLSSDTEVGKMHGFKQTHYFSSLKQQCRKHSGYIF